MGEPLARASFSFSLEDRIDVAVRTADHLPSIRSQRRVALIAVGVLSALVMAGALWLLPHSWSPPWIVAASLAFGALGMFIRHLRYPTLYRRAVGRILRDMYGDGTHPCDVEIGTDQLQFRHTDGIPTCNPCERMQATSCS